jgi:tetratricopeptide (TPR) repeat protein
MRIPCRSAIALLALAATVAGACAKARAPESTVPLFGNLGDHHRAISTKSKEAQRYFDQGLVLVFAFNHDEAIRSFRKAADLDPACAMPWWGIALANGPHINNPVMDEDHSKAAWEALGRARALAAGATPTERSLIEAVGARYADPAPANRGDLDKAYAAAMRAVWETHPEDADIGALYAEALMDLQPWDLWTADGRAKPGTDAILAVLESVLSLAPNHPLANHLYIHAVEASPHADRAVPSADRLRSLVPGAGHLVHMPAHIYSRVGRWDEAVEANLRAIEADRVYRERSPHQGFYRIYMAHNRHFLSWAAMMEGRSALAIQAAREMIAGIPPDFVKEMAFFADGYMTIALEALMRFGRWEEILAEPAPPDYLPITTAHWHFARGVAFAATDRLDDARKEQLAFSQAAVKVTDEMIVGNNPATAVLSIAKNVLAGEIAFREGRIDEAVERLREGVRIEDALKYNEAPDWIQPVRHTLGGVLLSAGRVSEAEAVYTDDLRLNAENGWSLYGLARCLEARDADAEARAALARFEKSWARADVPLHATCFCIPKT